MNKKADNNKKQVVFSSDSILPKPTQKEQKQFRQKVRKKLGKGWEFVADF